MLANEQKPTNTQAYRKPEVLACVGMGIWPGLGQPRGGDNVLGRKASLASLLGAGAGLHGVGWTLEIGVSFHPGLPAPHPHPPV